MKLSLKYFKNSTTLTTWYSRFPLILNVFFILPLILSLFDVEDVALYYLLSSFVRFQDIADFGFNFTYSRYYSYAYAGASSVLNKDIAVKKTKNKKPNYKLISGLFKKNKYDYLIISLIFFFTIGSYASYQLQEFFERDSFVITWLFFLVSLVFKIRYKYVESFIIGVQDIARLRLISGHIACFQVATLFVVLYITKDILAGIWVNTFFFWVIILRNYFLAKKICHEKKINLNDFKEISSDVRKELIKVSIKSGLGNVTTTGFYTTSGFILTPILSDYELAILLFSNKIIDIIRDFSRAPFYSKLPELNSIFIKNKTKLLKVSKNYIFRSDLVYFIGVTGFLVMGNFLLDIIDGDFTQIPEEYWIFISLTFFLERIGSISIQLYSVSNKVKNHIINTLFFIFSI